MERVQLNGADIEYDVRGSGACEVQLFQVVASKAHGSHQGYDALLVLPMCFLPHVQSGKAPLVGASTMTSA
jgi:hypothetical protein